jgi:hypothetical protein
MTKYSERTGRQPDFRVTYRKLPSPQRLFQHIRSNVRWSTDKEDAQWSIWPEFEASNGEPLPEGAEAPLEGRATMWAVIEEAPYRAELRKHLKVGATGFLMAGPHKIAEFKVIELLGVEVRTEP